MIPTALKTALATGRLRLPAHQDANKCARCRNYSPYLSSVRIGKLWYRLCETCKERTT